MEAVIYLFIQLNEKWNIRVGKTVEEKEQEF